ncbi:hypothetical protein ACWEQP_23665 [Streptomyces sp. NPDC004044]
MIVDRTALQASWNLTHGHLDAARVHLTGLPNIGHSAALEFLEHSELELAFDCMVDAGDGLGLSLTLWRHLDRAGHEMRLCRKALHKPHLTAAYLCRRHVAVASEKEQPAPGGPTRSESVSASVPSGHGRIEHPLVGLSRRWLGGSVLPVLAVPPLPALMTRPTVRTVFPVSPGRAVPAWRAGRAARTGRAGRTGGAGLDQVRLEVDVLCLQMVDLHLVGGECSRLRDKHEDQHGAEHKGAPRSTRRFVYATHSIPHSA